MSEFKAQLLGVLIVIGLFGIIAAGFKTVVSNTMEKIETQASSLSVPSN